MSQRCDRTRKSDLIDFCVKHKIHFTVKDTKQELCKAIADYFNNVAKSGVVTLDFSSRGCNPKKRGDGKTEWKLSELRDIMKQNGWSIPQKASKQELCKIIATKFAAQEDVKEIAEAAQPLDYDTLSIDKLRKICIQRGLKGCSQTRKRETFIAKLTTAPPGPPGPPGTVKSPAGLGSTSSKDSGVPLPPHVIDTTLTRQISIGEKKHFSGNLMANVNTTAANLASMIFLYKRYRDIVCVPLRPSYLEESDFGENKYCDFELCWSHIINGDGSVERYMEWAYVNDEEFFWEDIETYCTKRFAIIPMYITGVVVTKQMSHHNYILFDRVLKTVERFEPNGTEGIIGKIYGQDFLDDVMKASAQKHGYTYVPPIAFCPKDGPQTMEELQRPQRKDGDPLGFCTFWSLWYADRRLRYPDMPIKDLMDKLMNGLKTQSKKQQLRTFIRNYTEHVDHERREMVKLVRQFSNEDEDQIVIRAFLKELESVR
jgi:hypothetical protein